MPFNWDEPGRITPPDDQTVECRECGQGHDQADMYEHDRHLYCERCAAELFEGDDDGDE